MNWQKTRRIIGWTIWWAGVIWFVVIDTFYDAISQFGLVKGFGIGLVSVVFFAIVIAVFSYLVH